MYHYEHTNGQKIPVPEVVVDMAGGPKPYFESPYVKRWWKTDDNDVELDKGYPSHIQNPDDRPDGEVMKDLLDPAVIDVCEFIIIRCKEDRLTKAEILILCQRIVSIMIQMTTIPSAWNIFLGALMSRVAQDLDEAGRISMILRAILQDSDGGSDDKEKKT